MVRQLLRKSKFPKGSIGYSIHMEMRYGLIKKGLLIIISTVLLSPWIMKLIVILWKFYKKYADWVM